MKLNKIKGFLPIFVVYLCAFGWFVNGNCQQHGYFDHINTEDGLSQSDINAIYQDKEGFMWFGTHDGLNKYDGYTFCVYKPDKDKPGSISSNLIYAITGDDAGNLWIGTTGSGLNFFDRSTGKFTTYQHEKGNKNSLSNDDVSSLYIDKENHLWVGTNNGLNMLDLGNKSDTLSFQRYNLEQESLASNWGTNTIYVIFQDKGNQIWAGGRGGIYKLSRDNQGERYFKLVNDQVGLPGPDMGIIVHSIKEDKTGKLIVGTNQGLYCQSKNDKLSGLHRIDGLPAQEVVVDHNNNIWAGAYAGINYYDNSPTIDLPLLKNTFAYDLRNKNSITKNVIRSLFVDQTGIVWIGTNGGGVNKFDPERKQFKQVRKTIDSKSLSYDKIRSLYEDSNGYLWIGTEGGGLNMLSDGKRKDKYSDFVNFDNISKVFAITEVQDKNKKTLFIGVEDSPGLFSLDITNVNNISSNKVEAVEGAKLSVFALLEDEDKNLWIGTYGGGIFRWLKDKNNGGYKKDVIMQRHSSQNTLSSNIIRNIFQDRNKNLWFATANGLCKLSPEEIKKEHPEFEVYKNIPNDSTSLSHNYILEIYESKAGSLWIGTLGGGLNKYIPGSGAQKGSFISYSEKSGLPNDVIKGILEDDKGNLWISTNKGLSQFNPVTESFRNYDAYDGLQDNEFQELACLLRKDGEMLFGGINGFNAFYPDKIKENTIESETRITDFMISNRSVHVGEKINGRVLLKTSINEAEEIQLKYKENSFSFEFAALHYAEPRKNMFAYKLEGFDDDWVHTTADKRFATYTNIAPGDYTLKIKTSNNDGVWDKTPAKLRLIVIPPFWRTNFAYIFYCLLGISIVVGLWTRTIDKTNREHQYKIDNLEKEKLDEIQRMKLEFFTNISHEFRTPLTLIKGPLEYLQKNSNTLSNEVLQEQYNLMHKNTDSLMRLVNQLLDFRKMNQGKMRLVVRPGNVINFIKEVGEPFQFLASKRQIDFKVQSSIDALKSWFDQDALEKIINNLLSNAFKFTPDQGTISVMISEDVIEDEVSEAKAKRMLLIEVKDSGPGIAKSKLENIFDRFYMAKEADSRNPEGAGIGLSFVKKLVELHQGTISVKSKKKTGCNFIVRLPIEKDTYDNVPEISCKEDSESDFLIRSSEAESLAIGINDEIEDQSLSKSRSKLPVLLVVDDNADIRVFIKQALSDKYTVHEAENGKVGLEMALKLMPNIIITDVLMPVMDGIKFCKNLKLSKETSHIPVLMLTAKSSQESEIHGLKMGADDYIRKPFDMELLELKLTNIINQRDELRKLFNRKVTLQPQEVTVTSADEKFLQRAIDIVEKHMMNTDFNVEMLVKEMSLSRSNLYLKFKELTGLSSSEFIRNIRLKRAMQLLEQSDMSVKEIMYMTGFNTASYFSKCFKKQFGVVPSEYIKQTNQVEK